MDFRTRLGLVFVLIGCILGAMVFLDTFGEDLFPVSYSLLPSGNSTEQVFTKSGFLYGPQTWRPAYDPLGVFPGQDISPNETWYLMFVDLNMTPVSGNPNVKRLGSVQITYNFTDLAGTAVFHTYGLTNGTQPTRTNRQTGTGTTAFIVNGTATPAVSMPAAVPLAIPASHQYRVAITKSRIINLDTNIPDTRIFSFYPPAGSGQGALHITDSLSKRRGGVFATDSLNGTFYVTATGNDAGYDLILLVAVNQPQPDDFTLRIRPEFLKTG